MSSSNPNPMIVVWIGRGRSAAFRICERRFAEFPAVIFMSVRNMTLRMILVSVGGKEGENVKIEQKN